MLKKEISQLKVIKETLCSSKKHFSTLKLISINNKIQIFCCINGWNTSNLNLCNSDDAVWPQTMLKFCTLSTFVG